MTRRAAFLLGVGWLLGLVALNGALLLRPEAIRYQVDVFLAKTFRSKISYGRFSGGFPGDILLHDVELMNPDRPHEELLRVGAIRIGIDWLGVAFGAEPVRLITLEQSRLELVWVNGILDIPNPLSTATPGDDRELPRILLRGLELDLVDPPYLGAERAQIVLDDLLVELVPTPTLPWEYKFSAEVKDSDIGDLSAWGSFSEAGVDVHLSRQGFSVTGGLRKLLDPAVIELLERFQLSGRLDLLGTFSSRKDGEGEAFVAEAHLAGVDVALAGWPQRLENLHGIVRYEEGLLSAESLIGEFEGALLSFSGQADLMRSPASVALRGTLAGLPITDEFVAGLAQLPRPGPAIREQLEQWRVRGPVDLDFEIDRRQESERGWRFHPRLKVTLKDCDLVFAGPEKSSGVREGFAYPVRGLNGIIHLDGQGMRFERLEARNGPMSLVAHGRVSYERAGHETFSAQVRAFDVQIDERLRQALSADLRETLDAFDAEGSVEIQVRVSRDKNDPPSVPADVMVRLDGLRVRPKGFPYALDDVRGRILAKGPHLTVEALTARHGSGYFLVSGELGTGAHKGVQSLEISGREVPFDEDLFEGLAGLIPEAAQGLRDLGPSGKVGFSLSVRRDSSEEPPFVDGTVTLQPVDFSPPSLPLRLRDVDGVIQLSVRGDQRDVSIKSLAGTVAGERFEMTGNFDLGGTYDIQLLCPDLHLDEEFLTAMEPVLPFLKNPDLRPKVEGKASAKIVLENRGHGTTFEGEFTVHGVTVQPPAWRDTRMENVTGTLQLSPGQLVIRDLVAFVPRPAGLPPLRRGTTQERSPFDMKRGIDLTLESCTVSDSGAGVMANLGKLMLGEVPLEPWVVSLLRISPRQAAAFDFPADVTGIVDVQIESALIQPGQLVVSRGRVGLRDVFVGTSQDLYMGYGTLQDIHLVWNGSDLSLEGHLQARHVRLFRIPVPRLEARVTGAKDRLSLSGLDGIILGYDYEAFEPRTAGVSALRRRAAALGLVARASVQEWDTKTRRRFLASVDQGRFFRMARRLAEADARGLALLIPLPRGTGNAPEGDVGTRMWKQLEHLTEPQLSNILERMSDAQVSTLVAIATEDDLQALALGLSQKEREDFVERWTEPHLRALLEDRETPRLDRLSLEALREQAIQRGYVGRQRAAAMEREELMSILDRNLDAVPRGRILGQRSLFEVDLARKRFDLTVGLEDVKVGAALSVLAGRDRHQRGELAGRLMLRGGLGDLGSLEGWGELRVRDLDAVELPIFLNVLKALDISNLFSLHNRRTTMDVDFTIEHRRFRLEKAGILSSQVELELDPPGSITFDGVIDARLSAKKRQGIPIVSDILRLLPSIIMDGIIVSGPLENPQVAARSALSGSTGQPDPGRQPRVKPPIRQK